MILRTDKHDANGKATDLEARLLPHHLADLRRSGLTDEQIARCGFYSIEAPASIQKVLNWKRYNGELGACLAIPFLDADGKRNGYCRLKPDRPRQAPENGKPIKYESPKGSSNRAYFPPGTLPALNDPLVPLVITEGEKKAAKADQEEFGCLGLIGVYGWQKKRGRDKEGKPQGERELIDDLASIAWQGRLVLLCFDSDAATNPNVRQAEWHLANALKVRGAIVRVVRLSAGTPSPDGTPAKIGLDDFLVNHGPDAFHDLLAGAIEPKPPELSNPQTRAGKAHGPEPYRPFPVDALPALLAEYVQQGALALGCDPAYLALPCLAVAAGLIGYTRVLKIKRNWRVPAVLWTLVVAESGSLKTPAHRLATDHLFKLQKGLDQKYQEKLAEYIKQKQAWEAKIKAAKNGKNEPAGNEPTLPVGKTIFTSDATIEAVAELIGDNPRGLLVSCDELASWLNSFSRYKGKAGGTDLPRWLSMHSAAGFAYHRKTGDRRRIVVPNAAVSIAGGIQPGIFARIIVIMDFMEAGLAGRLLMAMPPRPVKKWTELEIDPDTENRYHKLLESLYRLEADGDSPYVLKLSPEAKAAWVRWYNEWSREQNAVEGELAAAFSKIEEAAARVALVHHVVTQIDRGENDLIPVQTESIAAGVKLARWFAQESRRLYAIFAESDDQRETRRLVEFIRARGGKMTARELQRANGRKYPNAATAQAALEALAEAGLGRWREPDGTHRAKVLELCPTPDMSDIWSNADTVDAESLSDDLPDSNGQAPISSGENMQVSDVSDCRTDNGASLARPERRTAGIEHKGQMSDTNCGPPPPGMEFLPVIPP